MPNKVTGGLAVVGKLQVTGGLGGDVLLAQSNTIARTDLTAKDLFVLPAGAIIHELLVYGEVASDAGTTATIDVGVTATSDQYLDGFDVLATQGAELTVPATANNLLNVGTSDVQVVGLYFEDGTASATGGPWTVTMYYSLTN